MTGGEAPAGEVTGGDSPAGDTPAGDTPAGDTPAGDTPAGDTPAGDTPAGEMPAGEMPAGDTPGGEGPVIAEDAPCLTSPTGCPELDWVQIDGGSFSMGSANGERDEQPIREVTVPTYFIMRSQVTVSMYRMCVDSGACTILSNFSSACTWSPEATDKEEFPANCMTWFQLRDFADWVGARLPSEAEWEFAARSRGARDTYPWGEENPTCDRATFMGCSEGTTEVCSLPAGNTEQGLCDMAGNVWEWVLDEYRDSYDGAPVDGSARCETIGCAAEPAGSPFRVMRGGYWSGSFNDLRTTYRNSASPIVEFGFRGGRLALSAP